MLTDVFVKQVKHVEGSAIQKYSDADGMYLLVNQAGKYWRFDYRFAEKRKTLALGVYPAVSLAQARSRRTDARQLIADGADPALAKKRSKLAATAEVNATFEIAGKAWLEKTRAKRKDVTQQRVGTLLTADLYPFIGTMPIAQIGPRDVLQTLRRIEQRGAIDTAHRANQICGQIFRYAVASGLAERDITTDLRGALIDIPHAHFAAITEPKDAKLLLRSIYAYEGHMTTVAALRLLPMVFVRPGELRTMEWKEIDLTSSEWRVPGQKMKMGIDHIVPLSTQAMEILKTIQSMTGHGKYVFPSIRTTDRPMSENTINAALRAMGFAKQVMTGHGFRAMARTIMDEVLEERVDLIEHQRAHAVKDANGRAYNRTPHLPARKLMMQRWANYLDELRIGEVTPS